MQTRSSENRISAAIPRNGLGGTSRRIGPPKCDLNIDCFRMSTLYGNCRPARKQFSSLASSQILWTLTHRRCGTGCVFRHMSLRIDRFGILRLFS
jgi:hypothetical protein